MDFVVLRGDRRQNLLCDLLVADGHRAQLVPEPEKWGMENLPPPGAFLVTAKASAALREAASCGVSVCAYDCAVTPDSLTIRRQVPVIL